METHLRTIYRSITWRIIALTTTISIIYIVTKNWNIALTAGLLTNLFKTIFFYIHERIWNKIKFGIE